MEMGNDSDMSRSERLFEITCRSCGQKIRQAWAWASRNKPFTLVCACGWSFTVKNKKLLKDIASHQSRMEDHIREEQRIAALNPFVFPDVLKDLSDHERLARLLDRLSRVRPKPDTDAP